MQIINFLISSAMLAIRALGTSARPAEVRKVIAKRVLRELKTEEYNPDGVLGGFPNCNHDLGRNWEFAKGWQPSSDLKS
jgi:hypothetical protein